jgi:hypothetical protein
MAAMKDIGDAGRQEVGRWSSNRTDNAHLPFRRRERAVQQFRQMQLTHRSFRARFGRCGSQAIQIRAAAGTWMRLSVDPGGVFYGKH